MYIMNTIGFELNHNNGVVKINDKKGVVHRRDQTTIILVKNKILPIAK